MADEFCLKIPYFHVTSTTWDKRLYFPSEGRHAEDFFALKNPTASAGFEPANLGTKGQHAASRPPKSFINMYTIDCGDGFRMFLLGVEINVPGPSMVFRYFISSATNKIVREGTLVALAVLLQPSCI